jgi:hypothetical protein
MSHAAAKIVGKLGGAMAGTLIGRPMYGWAVGGELAPELLNRIMAARSAKITAAPITVAEMTALDPVEKAGIQNGITRRLIENVEKGEPLPPLKKFENVLTREQMQQVMQAAMKNKAKAKPTGNPTATPSATPSATPAGGGGHAGNVAMSAEELSRPEQHYAVPRSGYPTYHGKEFDPGGVPSGSAHVTVRPDGTVLVNSGDLTPQMLQKLEEAVGKKLTISR